VSCILELEMVIDFNCNSVVLSFNRRLSSPQLSCDAGLVLVDKLRCGKAYQRWCF